MVKIKTTFKINQAIVKTQRHLAKNMAGATLHLSRLIQEEIRNSPGDPSRPRRPMKSSDDFASKPGNPPRTDRGLLMGSVLPDNIKVNRKSVVGSVTANMEYSEILELGTPRIAARPFMRPTLAKNRKVIRSILLRP